MLKILKNLLQAEIDPAFAKRAEFIFQAIEKTKPRKILDVGCGKGFYLQAATLYPFIQEIHGIDINETYLTRARQEIKDSRVTIERGSIYDLSYPDNSFDIVICSEVLEHLSDEEKALAEVKRVLKSQGSLLISVPHYNFPFFWDPINWILMRFFRTHVNKNIWWLAGIWADHERLYTKETLKKLVDKQGFIIKDIRQIVHYCWPFSHFFLYAIGKNIVEKLGVKQVDRFSMKEKKLARILAMLWSLPSKFDTARNKSFVSLYLHAEKNNII